MTENPISKGGWWWNDSEPQRTDDDCSFSDGMELYWPIMVGKNSVIAYVNAYPPAEWALGAETGRGNVEFICGAVEARDKAILAYKEIRTLAEKATGSEKALLERMHDVFIDILSDLCALKEATE